MIGVHDRRTKSVRIFKVDIRIVAIIHVDPAFYVGESKFQQRYHPKTLFSIIYGK